LPRNFWLRDGIHLSRDDRSGRNPGPNRPEVAALRPAFGSATRLPARMTFPPYNRWELVQVKSALLLTSRISEIARDF
jgi:hypothetical protein